MGHFLENLQPDGSLACYNFGVVEGMHEGVAHLIAQFDGFGVGVVVYAGNEAYLGTKSFGGLDFGDRSACGETDDSFYAVVCGGKCHALGMIAGRAGYHAVRLFLLGEL